MPKVCIDGDTISIADDGTWTLQSPTSKPLSASTSKTKATSTAVGKVGDVPSSLTGTTLTYVTPTHTTPGQAIIGSATPAAGASKSTETSIPLILDGDSGTFVANVTTPALAPSGTPDPVLVKNGTWDIAGSQSKFTSA